ncbi:MAG: glutamate:proton symporter [Bacteroidetes bacterium RIFCSPLOWO2_12_FULL_37_12]|nr:MAG: glutamate:proton symporter [Bacteroidetes bacterium RIFCSPLOWO2_12_FULL_37_12]
MKKLPLHTLILLALLAGLIWGLISISTGISPQITTHYIKPFGTIFVNLLKLIAIPLILASLITGVASLSDVKKLSRIGGKTIGIYILTTVVAIAIGLVCVNIIRPGEKLTGEMRQELMSSFNTNIEKNATTADDFKKSGPLQFLVDMVPSNLITACSDNRLMLQVVFFSVLFGVALIGVAQDKRLPVVNFFSGVNEVILRMIDFIMKIAPIGVFALISGLIVEVAGDNPSRAINLLTALLWYSMTVLLGLLLHIFLVYLSLLRFFTKIKPGDFFKGIRPVQLLAFSTSSSSATLPVTMECTEKNLGVSEEISSFVLPLGATINMDGTSLYQGVAAVFIAQALNMDLTFADQLMIVLTATLASIGAAGVPGAGMVMLVIVLEAIHVPIEGIALIVAVDRILDMCRTVVNVTGDAVVACMISKSEDRLNLSGQVSS